MTTATAAGAGTSGAFLDLASELAERTGGRISLVERLGEGGMGSVFRAADEGRRREVAVKALRLERVDRRARSRLEREARLLSSLDHPGICRLHEYVEGTASDFLVLELIRGRTLEEATSDGLSQPRKLAVALEIAEALAAAHARGIVHRDLSPRNVMITDEDRVKLVDFGSAVRWPAPWSAEDAAEAAMVVGTLIGMSPEQARGEPAGTASDVYSLGLLLQALFTGRSPYPEGLRFPRLVIRAMDGEPLPVEGLSPELTRLIEALEARSPEARPSAAEAALRLRRLGEAPKRRRRWLAAAAAVAVPSSAR